MVVLVASAMQAVAASSQTQAQAQANQLIQANKGKISPVQKVVQLIDDMAAKVQKELDETTADFEEYAKFCDDESVTKEHAIEDGKEQSDELSATITDATGGIQSAEATVEDTSTKISDTETELTTAGKLRAKENEDFKKTEKELLGTVQELSG